MEYAPADYHSLPWQTELCRLLIWMQLRSEQQIIASFFPEDIPTGDGAQSTGVNNETDER